MAGKQKNKRPDRKTAPLPGSGKHKSPLNPHLVLLIAIIFPGVGQVINNTPVRGFIMVFFMLIGAWICFNTTTPEHSFLGRYAGGWFVYAISIFDAYKWARYRFEYFRVHGKNSPTINR